MAGNILRYFLRNPHAVDNLEGVARWRLLEEAIHRGVEGTDKAMKWLVIQGFLQKVSTVGSREVFRLNPAKRAEAERFIVEMLASQEHRES